MEHLLARQYELTALIGRGPTGEVWRARDLNTRDGVAVKVLDSRFSADPTIVDRFVRERQVLMAFLHPSFVRVRDLIAGDGVVALVMEYVGGWDLGRHIAHSAGLAPATAARIGIGVAEALAAAHDAGVVHCDLKPSNVLLEEPTGEPRLTDCRVARLAHGFQGAAAWYSTPEYVSPEVLSGGPPLPATDVYALGLMLHEMLTGVPPYRGTDPTAILAAHLTGQPAVPMTVPPQLRRLIEECLDIDPVVRPSAREVAQRLQSAQTSSAHDIAWAEIVAGTPAALGSSGAAASGVAAPEGAPDGAGDVVPWRSTTRPPTRDRRRPAAIAVAALVAALVLAVVGVVIATRGSPQAGGGTAEESAPPELINAASPHTPPPTPAANATPETLEGATAFAYHWFEALNYAVSTGDGGALQAASSPQCRACADAATVVRDGYRDRSSLRGGAYTVRTVSADDFWTIDRPALRVVFDRSPRSAVAADGTLAEVFPGGGFLTCQILLERADGRWRVLEVLSPDPIA